MGSEQYSALERWYERLVVGWEAGTAPADTVEQQGERASENESQRNEAGVPPGHRPCAEAASHAAASHTMLLSVSRPLMACEFEVLQNQHQYPGGAEAAWDALSEVERLEDLLSVYRPSSELSKLNQFGATRAVGLSYDTTLLLELALDLWRLTDGAFDITAGALSEVWGFSRRQGRMPSEEEIRQACETVGSQWLELDVRKQCARFRRAGLCVNPGGIGKGFALDRAARKLLDAGVNDFAFHGGKSSVIARGHRLHPRTGGGWLVRLNHPLREQEKLGVIRLRNEALGTSGSGKQFFHYGGRRYSHIIDPRSGWPADQMLSATVICPSGAIADALATAMFVAGTEAAARWCQQNPSLKAILVLGDARQLQIKTFNVDERTWQPAPRYRDVSSAGDIN